MGRNLGKDMESLSISTKLQSIATGLQKIINHQPIKKDDKEKFEWGANLLGQIDWESKHYGKHPELSVIATELRPEFYDIFNTEYLERIYQTLKSQGKKVLLSKEELMKTYKGFALIATNVLYSSHPMGQI